MAIDPLFDHPATLDQWYSSMKTRDPFNFLRLSVTSQAVFDPRGRPMDTSTLSQRDPEARQLIFSFFDENHRNHGSPFLESIGRTYPWLITISREWRKNRGL
jgi:hypothetical protein